MNARCAYPECGGECAECQPAAHNTSGPRLERKQFYCGTKPSGAPTYKLGWVAHMPDGRVVGDETVDRGLFGKTRWEPRYATAADVGAAIATGSES